MDVSRKCITSLRLRSCALGIIAIVAMLVLSAGTMAAAPVCAGALLINPGDTVVMGAGAFGDCTGTAVPSTLLASLSTPFTTSTGNTSGTLISAVYQENGSGTLDFYYQVVLNTTSTNCGGANQPACHALTRHTNTDFNHGGTTTWVATRGDAVGSFSAGTVFPITADRNAAGDVVGFSFSPPVGAAIQPGQTSAILIVSTDAKSFTSGTTTVMDGGFASVSAFEPDSAVPPAISKTFGASTIALSGTTSLSFTIKNSNPAAPVTSVGFIDNLPAGLLVATPNGLTGSCGGGSITATAGSGTVSLTGATLAAGASCTFSVNVVGTTPGVKSNTTSAVTSNLGPGNTASATLTVLALSPILTKAFADSQIQLLGPSSSTALSFVLTNPNPVAMLTGLAFTDTLPSGLIVSTPNGLTGSCNGGTITAIAGTNSISLSGATLAGGASCTFSVNVTGIQIGVQTNTTSTVTSNEALPAVPATASTSVNGLFFFWFFMESGGGHP
jgi:hypothetical protein